jgi:murein DD-endopeptidase MepM/ murein hydrolase activator NlpD
MPGRLATRLALCALAALVALGVPPPAAAAVEGWAWPVRGAVLTPYRNGADPYAGGQHRGIDVAAPVGTVVVAAAAGTVRFAGVAGSSGLTVSIRTADGRLDTSYLHLSAASVRRGERVGRGDRLGAVGTSGRRSAAAPHLHFGVRDAGSRHRYRDPLEFLGPAPGPGARVPQAPPAAVPVAVRPGRAPRPEPSPRRVPARRPRGVPARRPAPIPIPGPSPRRVPEPAPRMRPAPAPAARRRGAPARVPAAGPAADAPPVPAPRPGAAPARRPSGVGPSLGLALACLGLLLAAAWMPASSLRPRWASMSRPRSTTSTASPT